ncbi:hypothetical protein [Streptomyces sp. NPDC096030]|uniref:hypothetical protein n=1 Tax=Streptomyces sp. NPDC096030 TaxID=3155423 RepID=UPI003320C7EA
MPQDPAGQETARILSGKLQRVTGRQTEHTIALASRTASLDRLEKGQEELKEMLRQLLSRDTNQGG